MCVCINMYMCVCIYFSISGGECGKVVLIDN